MLEVSAKARSRTVCVCVPGDPWTSRCLPESLLFPRAGLPFSSLLLGIQGTSDRKGLKEKKGKKRRVPPRLPSRGFLYENPLEEFDASLLCPFISHPVGSVDKSCALCYKDLSKCRQTSSPL